MRACLSAPLRRLLITAALALGAIAPAWADVWGYVDEKGVPHFASERVDARYELFFRNTETFDTTRDALDKLGAAGITRSVMILNGLGGQQLSDQHADNSARLANATQPEYLSTLVVSFPNGEARFRAGFPGWEPLGQHGLFVEMERFLSQLELNRSVFRSDHASNILVLKGTLGADKARLLEQVRQAIATPEAAPLRPGWARGL